MNTKYRLTFNSFYGTKYHLNLKKDYTGSVTTLTGTGSPVVISDVGEGSKKIEPIRGSELKFSFYRDSVEESLWTSQTGKCKRS